MTDQESFQIRGFQETGFHTFDSARFDFAADEAVPPLQQWLNDFVLSSYHPCPRFDQLGHMADRIAKKVADLGDPQRLRATLDKIHADMAANVNLPEKLLDDFKAYPFDVTTLAREHATALLTYRWPLGRGVFGIIRNQAGGAGRCFDFHSGRGGGSPLITCVPPPPCRSPPFVVPLGGGGVVTWSTQKFSLRLIVLLCG